MGAPAGNANWEIHGAFSVRAKRTRILRDARMQYRVAELKRVWPHLNDKVYHWRLKRWGVMQTLVEDIGNLVLERSLNAMKNGNEEPLPDHMMRDLLRLQSEIRATETMELNIAANLGKQATTDLAELAAGMRDEADIPGVPSG